MISASANDTDFDLIAFVPSSEAVDNIDAVSCVEVVDGTLSVDPPNLRYIVSNLLILIG